MGKTGHGHVADEAEVHGGRKLGAFRASGWEAVPRLCGSLLSLLWEMSESRVSPGLGLGA